MKNTEKNEILNAINSLNSRFDVLEGNFHRLESRFDGLEGKFNGLENRFDGLEGKFDGLEGRFDVLEGRFDNLEGNFHGLEGKFNGLESNFSTFAEDLASVKRSCLKMEVEHGEILEILKDAASANLDKHQTYDDFSEKTKKKLFNHDVRLGIIEDSNFYKREFKNKGFKDSPLL